MFPARTRSITHRIKSQTRLNPSLVKVIVKTRVDPRIVLNFPRNEIHNASMLPPQAPGRMLHLTQDVVG